MNNYKTLLISSFIFILTLNPIYAKNYNDSDCGVNKQEKVNLTQMQNSFENAYFNNLKINTKELNSKVKKTIPNNYTIIDIINKNINKSPVEGMN